MQKKFNNIYIFCPAGIVTGGVELLHQFCNLLNNNNKKAYIIYYGKKNHEIPKDYKKYNIKKMEEKDVIDSLENIILLPETSLRFLNKYHYAKAIIWWMSVDNYFTALQSNIFTTFYWYLYLRSGVCTLCKVFIKKTLFIKDNTTYSLKKIKYNKNIIYHAYQSEYARNFLEKHNIKNLIPLSDYINDDFIFKDEMTLNKEDIIIYNPKKGIRFTKKIISSAPDLRWIPIEKMNRTQVKQLMLKAKVYIDFGHFPGKDRMPREAAMCGCCIITGKLGAAGFKEDLDIDETKYKFNQRKRDIPAIVQSISYVMKNYSTAINDFNDYREKIRREKHEFEKDVMRIMKFEKLYGGGVQV